MIVNQHREFSPPPMRWIDRIALPLCWLALGPLLVYGSNATTPILAMLGLLYLSRARLSLPGMRRARQQNWWLPLLFLVLWAAASAAWSLRPADDLVSAMQLAATMAAGILLVRGICLAGPEDARLAGWFLPAAVALAAGIALAEVALDYPFTRRLLAEAPDYLGPDFLFRNNIARGMTAMLLLLWPAVYLMAVVQGRRLAACALAVIAAAAILLLPMGATKVALVLSGGLGLLALWRPRAAILVTAVLILAVGMGAAAALMLSPAGWLADVASGRLPDSWTHRLVIWQFVTEHVGRRPLVGFGFDASRRLGDALGADALPLPHGLSGNAAHRLPLHPHSMPLQIWLELGGIALLALLLAMAGALRLIWRMAGDRAGAAMALATFVVWLTIACLSFGAWQTWWLSAAWLAAAAVVLVRRGLADRLPGPDLGPLDPAAVQVAAPASRSRADSPSRTEGKAEKLSSSASPPSSAAGTMV